MKKATVVFVLFSIVASGLNYCIYPLLGRILPSAQYIDITVALSLFTQVSTFLSSIIALTIGMSKHLTPEKNSKVVLLQALLLRVFAVLATIFLIISPFVMAAINTPLIYAFPIVIMMLFSIPITVVSGYLNGKNLMVKLGGVTLISAVFQFITALAVASLTHSGTATMFSLTLAQIISIGVIYYIYRSDDLPSIGASVIVPKEAFRTKSAKRLMLYMVAVSISIMLISLVQVFDLFIVKTLSGVNIKLYTDVYIVSRAVFFGGMIFIWPFLGEVTLGAHSENFRSMIKVLSYFTAIALGAIAIIASMGPVIFHVLFGVDYSPPDYLFISVLSVLFKFFMLIITASILYFIVRRQNTAIYLSAGIVVAFFIFATIAKSALNIEFTLIWLNSIAFIGSIACVIIILASRRIGHRNHV